jgi:hypothetical protein
MASIRNHQGNPQAWVARRELAGIRSSLGLYTENAVGSEGGQMAAPRRVTGLWVYQSPDLVKPPPDPTAVAALAARHGLTWLSAQAFA